MIEPPKHIKFHNEQNPNAEFDLVRLEDIYQREEIDHEIEKIHLIEFYIILFIDSGQGKHTIDFTDYDCSEGTILTIRKDQIHKFVKSESLKGVLLLFTDDFLVSYLKNLEGQKTLQLFNELLGVPKIQLSKTELEEVSNLLERMKNEYFDLNDQHSLGILRSELHILITKLFRIKSKKEEIIFNRKYLNEFIQFQKLVETNVKTTKSVQDYAKMMNMSTKTLNNITKTVVNKTAKEFVDEICTKQIKRLLINTKLSIKEIAYDSGFEETTNFYKYFKHQTETTPEKFRENF